MRTAACAAPTDKSEVLGAGLVLRSVGYRARPVPGLPFDATTATVPNALGRIAPGVYVAGWIKRGPTGFIGTNKTCSAEAVQQLLDDLEAGLLAEPPVDPPLLPRAVTLSGWQVIDAAEREAGAAACPAGRKKAQTGGMSTLSARRWRWAVPGVAAVLVAGGAVAANTASAEDHPDLAPRSAADLLASLHEVAVPGLSGTVEQTSRLGLPDLPGAGGAGDASLSPASFATGTRTMRVWTAGPYRQRVALLGQLAESDIVRNGHDLWTYSSATQSVTHARLPEQRPDGAAGATGPGGTGPDSTAPALTPQQAADRALAAIDPTTRVDVDRTARVAGRPAYSLVLTPRDPRTLVGRVELALDSATSLPLRVRVFSARGREPAFEVGYTSLDLAVPPAGTFAFQPPPGSRVQEQGTTTGTDSRNSASGATAPHVLGSGWTAVSVLSTPPGLAAPSTATSTTQPSSGPDPAALLDRLTTRVPGGRLLTTSLLSVLLTDDGHVYVGAVRGEDLQRVAASGKGL